MWNPLFSHSVVVTGIKYSEQKRKRLGQPRQAQDKTAGRLPFNLLDGLACDLEGLGAGARQSKKKPGILPDFTLYQINGHRHPQDLGRCSRGHLIFHLMRRYRYPHQGGLF